MLFERFHVSVIIHRYVCTYISTNVFVLKIYLKLEFNSNIYIPFMNVLIKS